MRKVSRKWKGIISLITFALLVLYIEVVSYVFNTKHWKSFPQEDDKVSLRVLLVADPQIIGENNELPFFGLFTRWDADRYLQRNFMLAKFHTRPHVVAFLGDLFDEGSRAGDQEYRRYIRRFNGIFQLPRKQDPSSIDYIFIPGDNDVGGEGVEPVDPVKLKWFNQTFGDFRKELLVSRNSINTQFLKLNLIVPEEYQNPTKGREHLINGSPQDFRILLSHTSLLGFKTQAVQTVLEELKPQVILSAHSHHSSYLRLKEKDQMVKLTQNFLLAHKHPSRQWQLKNLPYFERYFQLKNGLEGGQDNLDEETLSLQKNSSFTIQLDGKSNVVQEISVPTCSYRMGVPHSGFGAFSLYKNGTLEYTVLWLPSRLQQLYSYLVIYFFMKISFLSWCLWKILTYLCSKIKVLGNSSKSKKCVYHKV